MRKLLLSTALIVSLSPVAAMAKMTTQEIVDMFPGAERIEIKRGVRATKVEVIVNGEKVEVTFDNVTNEERSRETRRLTEQEVRRALSDDGGFEDETDDQDELDDQDERDDDMEDDGDDRDGRDDDGEDDDRNDDDGEDDDRNDDDRSSDDDRGGDDDGGDDDDEGDDDD